jgi:ribosomal protein S18 acetylase RimI-like enzyme
MSVEYQYMEPEHIGHVLRLWSRSEGVDLGSDSPESILGFLERNSGLSWVAMRDELPVGAALCGQDGRRGYIHHLAVDSSARRAGIGHALVERCLSGLREAGIGKCHIFVFRSNQFGELFWGPTGWQRRDDVQMYSHFL